MTIPIFPTLAGISFPVGVAPMWSTLLFEATAGNRSRLQLWTYPRYKITLPFEFLRSDANAELQTLMGFVNSVGGDAQVFQFDNPDDYTVTNQAFGTGNGVATDFQLTRTFGGFNEPVFAPIGTPVVKIAGTPTVAFTLLAGGIVRFDSAPANAAALTWTGTYRWLCRFEPGFSFEKMMRNYWQLQKIEFITEKL